MTYTYPNNPFFSYSVRIRVNKSIVNIMSVDYDKTKNIIQEINNDELLSINCKRLLTAYSQDNLLIHTILDVSFLDVLRAVWNRIEINPNRNAIKQILNKEMQGWLYFTERVSTLVMCLNGFDDLVDISI